MREFKVVRFMPSRSAAPPGPPILPLVSLSTRMMCSRSMSSRAEEVEGAQPLPARAQMRESSRPARWKE